MRRVDYKVGTREAEIALAIDDKIPFFISIFIGWRRTFTIDNIEIMEFIFSDKDIRLIEELSKK